MAGSTSTPDARAALELTLFTAAIVIPLNAFFGLLLAWAVTRFEFRGKRVLLALVDLPSSSPAYTLPLADKARQWAALSLFLD